LHDELMVRELRPAAPASFESFVGEVEPRLRRALVAMYGIERGREATAEALAYAWEHWERISGYENLAGYLFRVAQSRSRRRKAPVVFASIDRGESERYFEPGLPAAMAKLSESQRLAVVLVHAFGWRITEVAELTGVKATTVQNHIERGLRRLRKNLGVDEDD
jgi:DNA-directed RNA polymerase specialized sigma24 family protein